MLGGAWILPRQGNMHVWCKCKTQYATLGHFFFKIRFSHLEEKAWVSALSEVMEELDCCFILPLYTGGSWPGIKTAGVVSSPTRHGKSTVSSRNLKQKLKKIKYRIFPYRRRWSKKNSFHVLIMFPYFILEDNSIAPAIFTSTCLYFSF